MLAFICNKKAKLLLQTKMIGVFYKIKTLLLSLCNYKTIGVRALVVKNNKVLLIRHTYMDGWYTIGGGVDANESPIEAISREIKEEAGITITAKPKLFNIYHNKIQKRDDYVIFYVVTEFTENNSIDSIEIAEKKWFPLSKLPENVSISTTRRIKEYLGELEVSNAW